MQGEMAVASWLNVGRTDDTEHRPTASLPQHCGRQPEAGGGCCGCCLLLLAFPTRLCSCSSSPCALLQSLKILGGAPVRSIRGLQSAAPRHFESAGPLFRTCLRTWPSSATLRLNLRLNIYKFRITGWIKIAVLPISPI